MIILFKKVGTILKFNTDLHSLTLSQDGSYTAYSKEYNEHYHSTKDGALNESLLKHIIPAFKLQKDKQELNILDICFGLGFNTLATVFYHKQNNLNAKLNIYSPELDEKLILSLLNFTYPKEFEPFLKIVTSLVENGIYEDEQLYIELYLGDAREYIKKFKNKFDIVYQDAFSPSANPTLWTKEYFSDISNAIKNDAILTTYSTALKTRLALHQNNFNIYINKGQNFRNATVASLSTINNLEKIDMQHKIACNPDVKPLMD